MKFTNAALAKALIDINSNCVSDEAKNIINYLYSTLGSNKSVDIINVSDPDITYFQIITKDELLDIINEEYLGYDSVQ